MENQSDLIDGDHPRLNRARRYSNFGLLDGPLYCFLALLLQVSPLINQNLASISREMNSVY